jgi:hypothetical protein
MREPRWRAELIAHADAVRAGRGDLEAVIRWLVCEIAVRGWPVRRLVGEEGAAAGLLLATRAPAPYRAGWLPKVTGALAGGGLPRPAAREFIARAVADR